MSDSTNHEIEVGTGMWFAIIWLFFLFWSQSGWYRLDCALSIQKACELIAAEYTKKPKP